MHVVLALSFVRIFKNDGIESVGGYKDFQMHINYGLMCFTKPAHMHCKSLPLLVVTSIISCFVSMACRNSADVCLREVRVHVGSKIWPQDSLFGGVGRPFRNKYVLKK